MHEIWVVCAHATSDVCILRRKPLMKRKVSARISTFGSQITSIISVSLVLLILGILAVSLIMSERVGNEIRGNISFVVKVDQTAEPADIDRLAQTLKNAPYADTYVYSSAGDILAREQELMGDDIFSLIGENPYGAEFEVNVSREYANGDSIAVISAALEADDAVEEIMTEISVIDSVNTVLEKLSIILTAIAMALIIISFVLINNTVSLAVYARRFVIHTMKLVGATGGFIRRPFLRAGLGIGAIAALIACVVMVAARWYGATLDPMVEALLPWEVLGLIFLGIFICGLMICLLASALATNRYLRANYDDMFMK